MLWLHDKIKSSHRVFVNESICFYKNLVSTNTECFNKEETEKHKSCLYGKQNMKESG